MIENKCFDGMLVKLHLKNWLEREKGNITFIWIKKGKSVDLHGKNVSCFYVKLLFIEVMFKEKEYWKWVKC